MLFFLPKTSASRHPHTAGLFRRLELSSRVTRLLAVVAALLGPIAAGNVASGVDGYKHFKFGMSLSQVQAKSSVQLEEISNEGFVDTFGNDCQVLAAADFPFLDEEREINLVFTRKGLASVIFAPQGNEFPGVAKMLAEKYGRGSLHPTPNGFQELATRFDAGQPNVTLKITYDDSTVVLIGTSDENADNFFCAQLHRPGVHQSGYSQGRQG